MATVVTVVGDVRLACALAALTVSVRDVAQLADARQEAGSPLVVVARDATEAHAAELHAAAGRRRALLPVSLRPQVVRVGPWIGGSARACLVCLGRRSWEWTAGRAGETAGGGQWPSGRLPPPLEHPALRAVVAATVVAQLERLGLDPTPTPETVRVAVADLRVTRHRWLPDPLCGRCGDRPRDVPGAAELRPQREPKQRPGTWRVRDLGGRAGQLVDRFVDLECGLVRGLRQDVDAPVPVVGAVVRLGDRTEHASGQALTYEDARLSALAEALERYSAGAVRGRRPTVRAAYKELGEDAVHPEALGMHAEAAYQASARLRPYRDDAVCDWLWGYSLTRGRPVLVPAAVAALAPPSAGRSGDLPFFQESSNGCALGSSHAEALLHGLFEVSERDGFLLTWYARLSVPEIPLRGHPDETVRVLTTSIEQRTGLRVRAFDTTLDLLPSVWALARDQRDPPRGPALLSAAGGHADPVLALRTALMELGAGLATARRGYRPADAARMVARPELVRAPGDHAQLYGHPGASLRLDFLLGTGRERQPPLAPALPPSADVSRDLRRVVGVFAAAGVEVVAVDQTPPELASVGLAAVRALAPGALPMTFGHAFRRVGGIQRLWDVPANLGFLSQPLTADEVNPYPHPFP